MNDKVDEKALRDKLLSGARWSVAVRLAGQVYSWLVTLLMVRLLTPADYGLNSMLEAAIEVLMLFSTLGIDTALVRFGQRNEKQLASAFGFLLLLNGLLFAVLFVGAPWIAAYFKAPQLEALVRVTAVVFVLSPLRTIPNALLDISLDFKLKAQVELQATIVSSLVALVLAYFGAGVWALVSVVVLNAILRAALLAWHRPWFVRPQLEFSAVRPLLAYGVTILAGSFVLVATGKIMPVVGGPVLGPEVLGLFAVASVFSYLPLNKAMPIVQQTLFPAFAKLSGDPALVRKYTLHSIELCTLTIVPVGIGIAAVSGDLVAVFFGPRWSSAAVPLAVLSALTPLRLLNIIFTSPLNATGHAKVAVGLAIANFAVILASIWFFLDQGVMGLVYLSCTASIVGAVLSVNVARIVFGVGLRDLLRTMGIPLLACAAMAASIAALNMATRTLGPGLSLAAAVLLGSAVYICTVMLLMGERLRQIRLTVLGR